MALRAAHHDLAPTSQTPLLLTGFLADKMPEALLRAQGQMHRRAPRHILINHLPDLNRQHREEHALRLHMRARIQLLVHLARQTDYTLLPLQCAVIRLR